MSSTHPHSIKERRKGGLYCTTCGATEGTSELRDGCTKPAVASAQAAAATGADSEAALSEKVRRAAARVFVQTADSDMPHSQLQQLGCGTLISKEFVITASHILPADTDAVHVWVLLGQQTRMREAKVHTRMPDAKEDAALLQLLDPVPGKVAKPLGLSLTPPQHVPSMAMVGFPEKLAPDHMRLMADDGGGHFSLDKPLCEAQIESLAHSSYDPSDGVAIGWYPCLRSFGGAGTAGSVVDTRDGRVVGVHTHMLWLNEHVNIDAPANDPGSLVMADIGPQLQGARLMGQFQTLAYKTVLLQLQAAGIAQRKTTSALATPQQDGFIYD